MWEGPLWETLKQERKDLLNTYKVQKKTSLALQLPSQGPTQEAVQHPKTQTAQPAKVQSTITLTKE